VTTRCALRPVEPEDADGLAALDQQFGGWSIVSPPGTSSDNMIVPRMFAPRSTVDVTRRTRATASASARSPPNVPGPGGRCRARPGRSPRESGCRRGRARGRRRPLSEERIDESVDAVAVSAHVDRRVRGQRRGCVNAASLDVGDDGVGTLRSALFTTKTSAISMIPVQRLQPSLPGRTRRDEVAALTTSISSDHATVSGGRRRARSARMRPRPCRWQRPRARRCRIER